MKILVTGAKGFVGKNLIASLNNIRLGLDRTRDIPQDLAIYEYDKDSAPELLDVLKRHHNRCPVMLSSLIQASLEGRFTDSEYGKSKKAGEEGSQRGMLGERGSVSELPDAGIA